MNALQKIATYRMRPIDSLARRIIRTRKKGKHKPSPETDRENQSPEMARWLTSIGLGGSKSKQAAVAATQKREKKQKSAKRSS